MEFIFINYAYTSNQPNQLFEEMQTAIEDSIEDLFSEENVSCVFHFIDASDSAYYSDTIDVEHTLALDQSQKQQIFDIVKSNVLFVNGLEEDELGDEELYETLEKHHYLQYAKFYKIDADNMIVDLNVTK